MINKRPIIKDLSNSIAVVSGKGSIGLFQLRSSWNMNIYRLQI